MRVVRIVPGFVTVQRILGVALLAGMAAACGELKSPTEPSTGGGDPIDPNATFTRVQNEIFTPSCAKLGCHDQVGQQQGQILEPGVAYAMIVNHSSTEMPQLKRVAPGDPANSYLYRKVTGAGITGDRMPFGGPYLSDSQLKLIRDWIRRGAPND